MRNDNPNAKDPNNILLMLDFCFNKMSVMTFQAPRCPLLSTV